MTHRLAVLLIKDYIYDLKPPTNEWFRILFNERSSAIWAAEEILHLIIKNPDKNPIDLVDNFASKMYMYSTFDSKTKDIFMTANEVAIDILDLLNVSM